MKKLFILLLTILLGVGSVNAKDQVTTLWEGDYTDNIAIPVAKLQTGGTVTVHVTAYEGGSLHLFYIQNNSGWTQKAFDENGGTIGQWPWVNKGDASYQFTIAAADMDILNDDTEETGSRGHLMIGTVDAAKVAINKITLTTSGEDEEGDATTVWSGSHDLAGWNGLALTGTAEHNVLKGAKKGDVIRITYTADEAGQINVCYGNWTGIEGGHYEVAVIDEPATIDFEIVTAAILEQVQNGGIVLNGTNALLSKVELLTFASSYDAVPLSIGSDGICTYGSSKSLDFSGFAGVAVPYYVSSVAEGTVNLTSVSVTRGWAGYIVQGTPGTYDIPVAGAEPDWTDAFQYLRYAGDYNGNWVYRSHYSDYSAGGEDETKIKTYYRYIFAKDGSDNNIAFYKLAEDYDNEGKAYHILNAHKAYLETPTDITPTGGARGINLVFEDETTGISSAELVQPRDEAIYTLSGMRVNKPARGLYITGGRKVLVK